MAPISHFIKFNMHQCESLSQLSAAGGGGGETGSGMCLLPEELSTSQLSI